MKTEFLLPAECPHCRLVFLTMTTCQFRHFVPARAEAAAEAAAEAPAPAEAAAEAASPSGAESATGHWQDVSAPDTQPAAAAEAASPAGAAAATHNDYDAGAASAHGDDAWTPDWGEEDHEDLEWPGTPPRSPRYVQSPPRSPRFVQTASQPSSPRFGSPRLPRHAPPASPRYVPPRFDPTDVRSKAQPNPGSSRGGATQPIGARPRPTQRPQQQQPRYSEHDYDEQYFRDARYMSRSAAYTKFKNRMRAKLHHERFGY